MERRDMTNKISATAIFKRVGRGRVISYFSIPIVFLILMMMNTRTMFKITSENVDYNGNYKVSKLSEDFRSVLDVGAAEVSDSAYMTEMMISKGYTNAEIKGYYVEATDAMNKRVADISTGLYGYINGEFLDGSGWIPDPDYVPTEHPWYKEAVEAGGDIVYCSPYVDSKTGEITTTIAKLLSDGESVIALDLNIEGIQKKVGDIKDEDGEVIVMILSGDGTVAAHSDSEEVGKNYYRESESDGKNVVRNLFGDKNTSFRTEYKGESMAFFARSIGGGWYAVSATNAKKVFKDVRIYVFANLLFAIIGMIGIFHLITSVFSKRMQLEDSLINVNAISGVYIAMFRIHIPKDSYRIINCESEDLNAVMGTIDAGAQITMNKVIETLVDERSQKDMLEFVDFDTLGSRLNYSKSVTMEFLGVDGNWCRGRFISAERDEHGKLEYVLYVLEAIDEEKKTREKLLYLSETDSMTGINNRGSGENKIRRLLLEGTGGMLILFDVDKFKSINDNFGHGVGDKVIIAIGKCLQKAFRGNDISLRLGGDEFAVFAPEVYTREVASNVIDRLLACISAIDIPELKEAEREVQVSVGVAFYQPADTFAFEELYKRADDCTYQSKKHVGNYVTFYEDKLSHS